MADPRYRHPGYEYKQVRAYKMAGSDPYLKAMATRHQRLEGWRTVGMVTGQDPMVVDMLLERVKVNPYDQTLEHDQWSDWVAKHGLRGDHDG